MAAPAHSIQVALNWPETAIKKDNLSDWVQIHYSKNYFCWANQIRDRIKSHKSEPRFGRPRGAPARAERWGFIGAKSMGGTLCRLRICSQKAEKFCLGALERSRTSVTRSGISRPIHWTTRARRIIYCNFPSSINCSTFWMSSGLPKSSQ